MAVRRLFGSTGSATFRRFLCPPRCFPETTAAEDRRESVRWLSPRIALRSRTSSPSLMAGWSSTSPRRVVIVALSTARENSSCCPIDRPHRPPLPRQPLRVRGVRSNAQVRVGYCRRTNCPAQPGRRLCSREPKHHPTRLAQFDAAGRRQDGRQPSRRRLRAGFDLVSRRRNGRRDFHDGSKPAVRGTSRPLKPVRAGSAVALSRAVDRPRCPRSPSRSHGHPTSRQGQGRNPCLKTSPS